MSGRALLALVVAAATTSGAFAQRLPQPTSLAETVSWNSGVAYAYDPSGNIVTAGADTYGYDGVGRLVRSTVNGTERRYAYDAHGNMISCVQWPDTPSASPCTLSDYGTSPATNRLTAAVDTDTDPTNDTYDAAGNVVRLTGHTYTYDALDMQVSDSSALGEREYVYDADGERIAIHILPAGTAPPGQPKLGEWRWTFRDASGKVLREFRSADTASGMGGWTWVRDYVWRDGQLLASLQRDASGTLVTYHYHLDHLGTPRRVTDDADRIVGIHDYHPFGVELSSSQDEPLGGSMRFTGHERDAFESDWTTTLDYMHARFYSSAAGRFLSVDPVLDSAKALKEPQRWNRYAYVINNPLRFTDPDGREIYAQAHEVTTTALDYVTQPTYHVSIRIEPADQAAWANDARFSRVNTETGRRYATIGAGPENAVGSLAGRGGALIGGVNRPTDVDLSTKVVQVKVGLGGRDENKVIGSLLATASGYKNDKSYELKPQAGSNGYNSNSFVSGLLRAVGLVPPTIRMNVPGYSKPLPMTPCTQGAAAPCR